MATTTTEQSLECWIGESSSPAGRQQLTGAQQQVLQEALSWLTTERKEPFAVLRGYAGVGKTFTVNRIVEALKAQGVREIGMAASTHKAVEVLKSHATIPGLLFRTGHSMLGLKEKKDYTTGRVTFVPDDNPKLPPPPVRGLKVLIWDEASMIVRQVFNYLVPYMKAGLKVLFVGDPAQIPPVGEPDSIPFLKAGEWGALELELTEIIRQEQDNPLLNWVTTIRKDYRTGSFTPSTDLLGIPPYQKGIQVVNHKSDQEDALLQDYFNCPEFRKNPDHMKVIAWTNATVDSYNRRVRGILYGSTVPRVVAGEKLIMDCRFESGKTILNNNTELEVLRVKDRREVIEYALWGDCKHLEVHVHDTVVRYRSEEGLRDATIPIVSHRSLSTVDGVLKTLVSAAQKSSGRMRTAHWREYFSIREQYAEVKYNYAITGHKCQGSSYQNCLVLKWDIDNNARYARKPEERAARTTEQNRILYTACTRPRQLLFIEP